MTKSPWRGRREASAAAASRPRLQDSRLRRRVRGAIGLALLALGLAGVILGVLAAGVPQPAPVALSPDGETSVPRTYRFHNQWVLFAVVEDPRRVPDLAEVGCLPHGPLRVPAQPQDITIYGTRVIEGDAVSAVALLSRSGQGATMRCGDAADFAPLWLLPSSEAPAFTPTAITIAGFLAFVAGLLIHPAVGEVPERWRSRSSRGQT